MNAVLAAKDPAATDQTTLSAKSVAVQGLTALEYLLYGDGSDTLTGPDGAYRCAYAAAAAANVDRIAQELNGAWAEGGPATRLMTEPGAGNPLFQTHHEAAGKLIATIANGLELAADSMVGGPSAPSPTRPSRRRRRSGAAARACRPSPPPLRPPITW